MILKAEIVLASSTILLVPMSSSRKTSDRSSGLLLLKSQLRILKGVICVTTSRMGCSTRLASLELCASSLPGLRNCIEPFAELKCIPVKRGLRIQMLRRFCNTKIYKVQKLGRILQKLQGLNHYGAECSLRHVQFAFFHLYSSLFFVLDLGIPRP